MHKKNIIVAVLILAVFIIGGIAVASENDDLISRNSPPAALTDMFVGTYNYEDNSRCSITVLPEENAFVYFDYDNENFFKGQFTQKTEDTYELTADDLDTCEIQCQDLTFKLTMDDSDLVFVKISENPIVPTNLEELLRGAVADYDCGDECDLHVFQYHFIPAVLMDYVGETEYASWKNTVSSDYEDFNIVNFIEHFNITKSEFAEMEDEMGTADFYDLEILFDGNETERSNFFLNTK